MKGDLIRSTRPPRTCITVHSRTPEAIKNCYTVMSNGENIFTTVTKHPDVVTDWIATTKRKSPLFVGFEIEFDVETTRVGTLQLCTDTSCLIFQLDKRSPLPASLDRFLGDQNYNFIGHNINSKLLLLRSQYTFLAKVQCIDLRGCGEILTERKRSEFGLLKLGKVETNWDRLPNKLSHAQVHYACLDVFFNRNMMFSRVRNFPYIIRS